MEQWKEIAGFEGYEVSNLGNIRSYINNRWGLTNTPKCVKTTKGNRGYLTVQLGRGNRKLVHRLVAEAFIPNPEGHPLVLHNDSNRSNPVVSNLRWGTQSENIKQGVDEGSVKPEVARAARSLDDPKLSKSYES